MLDLGAKDKDDHYSTTYSKGGTSSLKYRKQVKNENRNPFGKAYVAIVQFSSRLIKATEQSTKEEDAHFSLYSCATVVTESCRSCEEFVKELREYKIISNKEVLLVFDFFAEKRLHGATNKFMQIKRQRI